MNLELINPQTILVVRFKSYKVRQSTDGVEYAGKASVVGISQTNTPLSWVPSEDQRLLSCSRLFVLPALGMGSRCKCSPIMGWLFSLKWNLCSFLSRGVIKISFLLLVSPNCFIWHSDEKC